MVSHHCPGQQVSGFTVSTEIYFPFPSFWKNENAIRVEQFGTGLFTSALNKVSKLYFDKHTKSVVPVNLCLGFRLIIESRGEGVA